MNKNETISVTVQPVLKPRHYEAGGQYNGNSLGNLLVRRVGSNTEKHVINCKDPELRAYFRGLADAGMIYAHNIVDLMDKADELHVSWAIVPKE